MFNKIANIFFDFSENCSPAICYSSVINVEQVISVIWCEVLKVSHVGTNDNFFDLGGYSDQLEMVHYLVSKRLGKDIPLVDMYSYPTIKSFVAYLQKEQGDNKSPLTNSPPYINQNKQCKVI